MDDLFRAATRSEPTRARCVASELHGTGCALNAGHRGPCLVWPLDTCSPDLFLSLTEEDE
jgi:hypothetical protein